MGRASTIYAAIRALAPDLVSRSAEPAGNFFSVPLRRSDGKYMLQVLVSIGKNEVETNLILDGEWADRADLGYPRDGTQPVHQGCTSQTVARLIAEISRLNRQEPSPADEAPPPAYEDSCGEKEHRDS